MAIHKVQVIRDDNGDKLILTFTNRTAADEFYCAASYLAGITVKWNGVGVIGYSSAEKAIDLLYDWHPPVRRKA